MFEPDVLVITIAANIGDTAILDYPACFPDSLVGITPKLVDVNIYYLNYYLRFIKKYLEYLAPQSAQKNINLQQLSPTPIVLPPLERQQEIVDIFNVAYQQKQEKETQAKQLLAGIDDYLLSELGITLPEHDNSLNKRIFTTKFSKLTGSRFDSYFLTPYFAEVSLALHKSKFPICKLGSVLNFIDSGARPSGGVSNISDGVLSLGGEHVNDLCEIEVKKPKFIPFEFHKQIYKTTVEKYDILLVKDGATTGKVGILDNESHVGANINEHVFLMRSNSLINQHYLAYYLHSFISQQQIQCLITGATVTGLTKNATKLIELPLPPMEKQKEIAEKISQIRQEAKQLQEDGANILANAKMWVEQMILGN